MQSFLLRFRSLLVAALWFADGAGIAGADSAIATDTFKTPAFVLKLHENSQTLASLAPVVDPTFDFAPSRRAAARQEDGFVHLGDLHLRLRADGSEWRDFATAQHRVPVRALGTRGSALAAADITATFGASFPLRVERRWLSADRALILRFTLTNPSDRSVEIGGLGLPMVFDNILTDRSLDEAHAQASFVDPSISQDAGYLQVTRLNGRGPVLLVLPDGRSPLEAYRPILEPGAEGDIFTDRTRRGQTFEGFYDWMIASAAFREREWRDADTPWNPPTSIELAPGASREIGVRFVLAPQIRDVERVLIEQRRPVAIGIPGYVVPTNLDATLFLKAPATVSGISVEPEGALDVTTASSESGWLRYSVRGVRWGRARLHIRYTNGTSQSIAYFVTKPAAQTAADLGAFTTRRQLFDDTRDPFGRAPAILTFDREANAIVTQDTRAWIAGMSDEGGAGGFVAAVMKQLDNPVASEVATLERVVDATVHRKLQTPDGGVRKSLFYYDAKRFPDYYDKSRNWTTWASWPEREAHSLGRSFNYPHVAAGYWVLYRLARFHEGLVQRHEWRWYLTQAAATAQAMVRDAPEYAQFGQMEGEVFLEILRDLRDERMHTEAASLDAIMKRRADHWRSLAYPFGSEMPWDSTGQPEVYAWMRHFGYEREAAITREVILAYDPALPSWAYNGNARRYWDFLYAGKLKRIERQVHHYGSALNAVPLFDAYRSNPHDLHLLRVAYGGLMGALTNIDQEGFGSAAFHSNPDSMRFDALTGDYGMGFFGHAYATATYLVNDPTFGWLGFGGQVTRERRSAGAADCIRIEPRDSARSRLFIAPQRLWLTLAAGKFSSVEYCPSQASVTIELAPATADAPRAFLRVEATGDAKSYAPDKRGLERGYHVIALGAQPTSIPLQPTTKPTS